MKLYVDSSLSEACWQFEGQQPVRLIYTPRPDTHNIGEYRAVEYALRDAWCCGYKHLQVFTDSQLVVGQTTKDWKCNVPHLKEHIENVRSLLKQTESTLEWTPREENLAGIELERKIR